MARCPKCQHELSNEELHASQCAACGHTWDDVLGDASSPDAPEGALGSAGGPQSAGDGPRPQAVQGGKKQGMGLSSASEPETWNEDGNARTLDASELEHERQHQAPPHVPQPIDLNDEDVVRLSLLWGDVKDEVPSGMTIKSREANEIDDAGDTVDVSKFRDEEFSVDDSSQTYAPDAEPSEEGVSSVGETFISDQFPPVNPESASDEKAGTLDTGSHESGRHDTPEEAGGSSYDRTVVSDEFASDEHGSQDLEAEAGKTAPLSGEGPWAESDQGQTYAAPGGAKKPADDAGTDSSEKTLISKNLSDDQYTDSGSAEAGHRTDALGTEDVSGIEAAEGSGLTINLRSMIHQDDPASEKADYQILSLLGEGGMGKVYNARQTSIDRVVAVKMLKPKSSGRKRDQHAKFLAEAVVTGELDHPNIVPIYDVGRDNQNALFYSMKNVTGNPWLDTIHQKSTHDNLEILMSVADAVAFAHARGVVHRDLKPENVMLGEFGEVLVMDWGLAMPTDKFRKQRGMVRSTSMGGTPAYMAPEMATGPITKIGSHSDIYLLGAMLFEIVTGRPPHRGKNAMKCLMAAARNKIVTTEHTGELIEIAYKAMSTNPKDRYKSVQEFQTAVRTYLAHSESITLAALAEEDLERAQKTDNYEDYAKARFGFEEALKLWEGNKRAKGSLGAARLAYAHCAMGKGDYDLAASLLDPHDMAHDKLKVDIAKAREERDARQKRLEAAKRMGMALALLLFVVVSGAAVWINNERQVAEDRRVEAEDAKDAAVVAQKEAEDAKDAALVAKQKEEAAKLEEQKAKQAAIAQRDELARLNELAERRRREAEAQSVVASLNAIMAEEQQTIAEAAARAERLALQQKEIALANETKERERAESEKARAEAEKSRAEAEQVLANLNAIMAEEQQTIAEAAARAERLALQQKEIALANETKERERAESEKARAEAEQVVANLNAIMAEEQQLVAEAAAKAEREALEKEQIALANEKKERERAESEKARAEVEKARAEAEQVVANLNAIMADEQKLLAQIAQEQERIAKLEEREARIEEQRKAYIAKVGLAAAKIEENAFDVARNLLADPRTGTNPRFRNWEWGYLMNLCQQAMETFQTDKRLEAVALIGEGQQFVVGGADGLVQIRDINDPQTPVKSLQLPAAMQDITVLDVAVSPAAPLIALATDDTQNGFIKLWNYEENKLLPVTFGNNDTAFDSTDEYRRKLENRHMDPVTSVQFSQDGSKLLTASQDKTARVWNVQTGSQLVALPGTNTGKNGHFDIVWDAAFVPNPATDATGKRLPETKIVTVSEDKKALVWVDATGKWSDHSNIQLLPPFTAHEDPIYTVGCSLDGQYVATGGFGRRVLLWKINEIPQVSEDELFQMRLQGQPLPQTPFRELVGHDGPVRSVAFGKTTANDRRDLVLLTGSDDNTIRVWNVDEESLRGKFSPVKTFRGHGESVRDCEFNPGGTSIVSVSRDRSARLWSLNKDADTEVYLVNGSPLDGHEDPVDAVDFSFTDSGKKLVTASRDNTAKIYTLDKDKHWKLEHILQEGHANIIPSGVYFDGGKQLATASYDNTVRVWDVVSGTEKFKLTGTGSAGVLAVSGDGRWIVTGSDDSQKAKLWDTENPQESIAHFGKHGSPVTAVAISNKPDENGRFTLATADNVGRCIVWQWKPGDAQPTETKTLVRFDNERAHHLAIVSLHFLPQQNQLLTASLDHAVTQWNVASGQTQRDFTHPAEVTSLNVTPDGKFAVTTCYDNVVRLWNLETGETMHRFRPQGYAQTLVENVAVQFRKKNAERDELEQAWKLIAPNADLNQFLEQGGWEQSVDALQAQIPQKLENLNEPPRELAEQIAALIPGMSADDLLRASTNSAAISYDGRYVVAANRTDDIVHGWRLPAGSTSYSDAVEFALDDNLQVSAVAFSPVLMGAEMVVLGFSDARPWKLETTAENTVRPTAAIPMNAQDDVASASFSRDGEFVVTAARDKAARVWNVKTGQNVVKLQQVQDENGKKGHTAPINAAIWAPEGFGPAGTRHILTASDDQTAILWKLTPENSGFKAEVVNTFNGHTGGVLDAAFSPDGSWIVTVSRDGSLRVWDAQTAKELASEQQEAAFLCVACSEDGKEVLTGSADNTAIIWSVKKADNGVSLERALELKGHSAEVTDVAFSPLEDLDGDGTISDEEKEGQRAVTASADNTVIMWDTRIPVDVEWPRDANQVLTLKRHNRPVNAVQFSPDGRWILTGSEDHRAILWPTQDWTAEKRAEMERDRKLKAGDNLTLVAPGRGN